METPVKERRTKPKPFQIAGYIEIKQGVVKQYDARDMDGVRRLMERLIVKYKCRYIVVKYNPTGGGK